MRVRQQDHIQQNDLIESAWNSPSPLAGEGLG